MTVSNLHVVVGDVYPSLGDFARDICPTAYLVNHKNINQNHVGVVYTNLGDIDTLAEFYRLLSAATEITFCEPEHWSDKKTEVDLFSMAWLTKHYVMCASRQHHIKVSPSVHHSWVPEPLAPRRTDGKQLWISGCSTTVGVGVHPEQCYTNLLATKLQIPVSVLAERGANIPWMVDQLLRSDLRAGDIVILGATTYNRVTIHDGERVRHIGPLQFLSHSKEFKEITFEQFNSPTRIYESIRSIRQLINVCNKLETKLVIIGIHANLDLSADLCQYPNFIFCHGTAGADFRSEWLDIGFDRDQHPGPQTHQMYTDLIASRLHLLYSI